MDTTILDLLARSPRAAIALDVAVKATLVLAATAVATLAMRRSSAAARHLAWCLGLGGALMLPVLSLALPGWDCRVLPAGGAEGDPAPIATAHPPAPRPSRMLPVTGPLDETAFEEDDLPGAAPATSHRVPADARSVVAGPRPVVVVAVGGVAGRYPRSPVDAPARPHRAAAIDARRPADRGRRLDRPAPRPVGAARPVAASHPAPQCPRRDADDLGLAPAGDLASGRRRPLVHRPSPRCPPARAGARPAIRLPDAVARAGGVCSLLVQSARLVRRAADARRARARLRRRRAAGRRRASEYAFHLLEIARGLRAPRTAALAALAMARPSQLEGRLVAILDPDRRRRGPGRKTAAIALLAALFMLLPLAMLRSARGGRQPRKSRSPASRRPPIRPRG